MIGMFDKDRQVYLVQIFLFVGWQTYENFKKILFIVLQL